jgi:hypothetical protein
MWFYYYSLILSSCFNLFWYSCASVEFLIFTSCTCYWLCFLFFFFYLFILFSSLLTVSFFFFCSMTDLVFFFIILFVVVDVSSFKNQASNLPFSLFFLFIIYGFLVRSFPFLLVVYSFFFLFPFFLSCSNRSYLSIGFIFFN